MKKEKEIAIYVEGGLVTGALIVEKGKPPAKWKVANYTLIDFDVDGAEPSHICAGCLYSNNRHYADYCGHEKVKTTKRGGH